MTRFISALLLFIGLNSYSSVAVVNGLSHYHSNLTAGDVVEGVISLVNSGDSDQRIRVYFNDYERNCETSVFHDSETYANSIYQWFSLSDDDFIMNPGAKKDVRYKIIIPADFNEKFSLWQFIMIENDKLIEQKVKSNFNVNSKVRYGINIGLDFGNSKEAKFSIDEELAIKERVLKFKVKNSDVYFHKTNVTFEVHDINGELVKKFDLEPRTCFPNACTEFVVDLSELQSKAYDIIVYCDSGYDINAFKRQINLVE